VKHNKLKGVMIVVGGRGDLAKRRTALIVLLRRFHHDFK